MQEVHSGQIANEHIEDMAEEQRQMVKAENAAVANSMGWEMNPSDSEDGKMRVTVLGDGDVTVDSSPKDEKPKEKKRGINPLLAAALGAAIPGGPLIGYAISEFLSEDSTSVVDTDTVLDIGLQKLKDLKTKVTE
jgi:hypothetical protein